MNTEVNQLATGLSELAESPAPPSGVDVFAAVRTGRARVRRRRFAVLTAAVLAVGASTLVVLPGGRASSVAPAEGPSARTTPSPTSTGSPAPVPVVPSGAGSMDPTTVPVTGTDPLSTDAAFGWLPGTVTSTLNWVDWQGLSIEARGELGANTPDFRLKVYPAGRTPDLKPFPTGADAIRVDAPPVNGREAYWVSSDDPAYRVGLSILRWKSADGRWAELTSTYLSAADQGTVPLRIAAAATIGTRTLSLPFRLSGVPDGFKVSGMTFTRQPADSRQPWSVELNYAAGGSYFTTTVTPDTAPDYYPSSGPPHACVSDKGVRACVAPLGGTTVLDPVGGTKGWLGKLTLLGTDESRWTTDVLG